MGLNLEQKQAIVADLAEVASKAHSGIAAEYAGLSVAAMTSLRKEARSQGVYLRVVRNTLARRALENTDFACMRDGLVGPLVLAFSLDEPGAGARILSQFAKTNDRLSVKLVALGGKLLPPTSLDAVANLPTRLDAISILMGVMKAPISKFVRTVAEPHARLVRTVGAIRDKKQAA
jgi:large subunit ribosomal protein L10